MLNEIKDFLKIMQIKYICQYQINKYRIDMYLPDYNIAIEIDEDWHKYYSSKDINRENDIVRLLNCKFIRIKENNSCGVAIGLILKLIKD